MFETVDQVPWDEVETAYGPAFQAPSWIRALGSDDRDLRMDAVNEFLWSSAFHQYTLYSATPFIIKYVIEALTSRELCARDDGTGNPMKRVLLSFLRLCAEAGQRAMCGGPHHAAPTIEEAVRSGGEVYAAYESDLDLESAADAKWLSAFCRV